MEDLKRCPFCGNSFVKKEYFRSLGVYFIRCLECGVYLTAINNKGCLADDTDEYFVAEKWNRRAKCPNAPGISPVWIATM